MNSAVVFMLVGLFLVWAIASGRAKALYLAVTKPDTATSGN